MAKVDVFSKEITDEYNDDYLEHYGTKGMKWGVRKAASKGGAFKRSDGGGSGSSKGGSGKAFKRMSPSDRKLAKAVDKETQGTRYNQTLGSARSGEPVTVYSSPKRGVVATRGGQKTQVSEDAEISAAFRHVAANNSIASLSNKQLELVTKRMTLETNYQSALQKRYPPKQNKLKKIAKDFIDSEIKSFVGGKPTKSAPIIQKFQGEAKKRKSKKAKAASAAAKVVTPLAVGAGSRIVKSTVVK